MIVFSSRFSMRVIYAHTDMMGRAYYSRYFEYFEAARSHMLRELGLPYAEIEKMGVFLPVIESHCPYKNGATFDDLLSIQSTIMDFPRSKIRIDYGVTKEVGDITVAEGYTVHTFVNSSGKVVRPPKAFVTALRSKWQASHD
ncbi:MAG: thioesterase family protein [Candidatus Neomarinimicrobiota bacterium]